MVDSTNVDTFDTQVSKAHFLYQSFLCFSVPVMSMHTASRTSICLQKLSFEHEIYKKKKLWLFLGYYQYWAGWVYGFCGFMAVSTQWLNRQWFLFKMSQKTRPQLKVPSARLVELGIKLRTPGYQASGLSTTSCQHEISTGH